MFEPVQNTIEYSWDDCNRTKDLSWYFNRNKWRLGYPLDHAYVACGWFWAPHGFHFVPAHSLQRPRSFDASLLPVCSSLSSAARFPVLSLSSCLSGTANSFLFLSRGCRHFQYRRATPPVLLAAALPSLNLLWSLNPRGSQPPHVHSAGCKLAHLTEAKRTAPRSPEHLNKCVMNCVWLKLEICSC